MRGFAWPGRALAGLDFLAFGALLTEGAMADWSAVYLRETVGADPGRAAPGFAVFSLMMAGGRLVGDVLATCWPAASLVRAGGLLSAAGLSLALPSGSGDARRPDRFRLRRRWALVRVSLGSQRWRAAPHRRHCNRRVRGLLDRPTGDRPRCRGHEPVRHARLRRVALWAGRRARRTAPAFLRDWSLIPGAAGHVTPRPLDLTPRSRSSFA